MIDNVSQPRTKAIPNTKLREWRNLRKLSQGRLAEKIGASQGDIAKLENGSKRTTVDWMRRLAGALDCRPQDLVPDNSDDKPPDRVIEEGAATNAREHHQEGDALQNGRITAAVGRRIEWIRIGAKKGQDAVADMINADPSVVAAIESGRRMPTAFEVIAIAAKLRVTTDYLLLGELNPKIDPEMLVHILTREEERRQFLESMERGKGTAPASGTLHPTRTPAEVP